jgi:hypothetical protein
MATLSLDIPNAQVARINAAFAHTYGGEATPAFSKACIINFIKKSVREYEAEMAVIAARTNANAAAEPDIT